MIKKLMPYVGRFKKHLIASPLTIALEVLLETLIPLMMARIVDIGIAVGDLPYVVRIGATMVGMAMLSLMFGALSARFSAVGGAGFARNLRGGVYRKIQDFSFYNIDRFSTASLITRLTTDVTNTQSALMMSVRMLIRAPLMLILASTMAFSINAQLMVIFAVAVPILAVAAAIIMTRAFPRFEAMLKKYDVMNASVQENLIAIRVVKAFVRGDYEKEKFGESADAVRAAQIRAEKLVIISMPLMQMLIYSCIIAILWFGGNQIIGGTMLTGELISFLSYVTQILMSLMMMAMVFVNLVLSRASVQRITEVLDEVPDIQNKPDGRRDVPDGAIQFDHVDFSYAKDSDNYVLTGADFAIRSGETIGILGGTGASKSSLVQLIPRLYDVSRGVVRVGGIDVRDYDLPTLRDAVAMVLQKNTLFSGTIRDNLLWGDANATQAEIEDACRAAQAHDFIMAFPDGYDTVLGQDGAGVSGGQRQRLCIARALLKHPKVLILDDSTSAVDTATDARIRQALRDTMPGTTKLIIAQRVASVIDADRIIIMHDGCIDAIGTHDELLASNEIYREVYSSQQKGVAA